MSEVHKDFYLANLYSALRPSFTTRPIIIDTLADEIHYGTFLRSSSLHEKRLPLLPGDNIVA